MKYGKGRITYNVVLQNCRPHCSKYCTCLIYLQLHLLKLITQFSFNWLGR